MDATNNNTLDRMELSGNSELGDSDFTTIADGLKFNSTLRPLDLSDNEAVARPGYTALTEVLRYNNFSLECISTDADIEVEDRLNLHSRLNRCGRREILQQYLGDRQTWIDSLIVHCSDDLDRLFYYLSSNTSLFVT